MKYEKINKRLKDEINELYPDKEFVAWLKEILQKNNPHWEDYPSKKAEFHLLSRIKDFLEDIVEEKPEDNKHFVQEKLKENDYDRKFAELSQEISSVESGDSKSCDRLRKKFERLIDEADEDIPGFSDKRDRMISEISGDILAKRTKGQMGSMRMILRIKEKKKHKEKK